MRDSLSPFAFVATLVALGLIGLHAWLLSALYSPTEGKPLVEYKDFVSILLTAVTVVVAVLAVGVAVLAVWGYKTITEVTEASAKKTADEIAKKHIETLLSSDVIRSMVLTALEPTLAGIARSTVNPSEKLADTEGDDGNSDIPRLPS